MLKENCLFRFKSSWIGLQVSTCTGIFKHFKSKGNLWSPLCCDYSAPVAWSSISTEMRPPLLSLSEVKMGRGSAICKNCIYKLWTPGLTKNPPYIIYTMTGFRRSTSNWEIMEAETVEKHTGNYSLTKHTSHHQPKALKVKIYPHLLLTSSPTSQNQTAVFTPQACWLGWCADFCLV